MTFKSNENEFLAVGVPLDASDFEFLNRDTKYLTFLFGEIRLGLPTLDKWEILGSLLTKEKMLDFDSFKIEINDGVCRTREQHQLAVIEMILSELKKEYPLEVNNEPHPSDIEPTNRSHYDQIAEKWHFAQSQLLPDRVLILRLVAAGGTRVSMSPVGDK